MTDKTTLTDISEVMTVLSNDHKWVNESYKTYEQKFKDIFGVRPNQQVTAWDVAVMLHKYICGNGGNGLDPNKN